MNARWQPGDLALCTYQGEWFSLLPDGTKMRGEGPRLGQILTVRSVSRSHHGNLCLRFTDFPDPAFVGAIFWGYRAIYFRKVTPPEADEFDREVIAALTGQPEQVPA